MRRVFITFLLAIAAFCGSVAFAQEKPILTFGCLSDLHSQMGLINGSVNDVRLRGTITNTLNAMKADEKLDLIVLGGDYTSDCTIPEANWKKSKELLMSATRNAFPEGAKTPVIYVDGNHEYEVANFDNIPKLYNAGEYYTTPMKQDIGGLSATDCFYETAANGSAPAPSLLAAFHYVVKGFDFVVLNTGKNYFKSGWDYTYSTESVQWCADKLAEIYAGDPNKTVFFLVHIPFSDSNSISNTNKGMNAGEAATLLKATLAKYPNLVMLYGHDHGKDTAYLRTSTQQRVTCYDTNGNKITEGPVSTSYYIQNYKNSTQYLTYNTATNMGVTTTKTAGTVASSALVSGTFSISFPGTSDTRYMHCGSSGRFSGNTALSANSSLYTYKVVDPSAATVVANKVSKIENGGSYIFVALSSAGGYYMLTDEIYGSGTDQRMVGSNISATVPGDQITFTPSGSYSPIWKLTDTSAPEPPVDVKYSVKNYKTSKYLGFDAWNMTTKSAKSVCTFEASTVTSGAFTVHIEGAPTLTANPYVYCGTNGRFSGNKDNTVSNSQVELFKVENPAAATISATRVTAFKGGETYLLVIKRSEGYYMLTDEMYQAGTDNQRMIGQAVTVSGGKITYTPGANSALWTVESDVAPAPPAATPSFFSSFMGSMRYYSNSIEGDVSVSNSKIVQALMVYVYSDRVELHMKNYGQSGTFGSITINKDLTPYVSPRVVTHSEEAKTAAPAFEGETGGRVGVNTPVNIKVTAPEDVSVYYTTDGSAPTEKSAKADKGVIKWTPSVAGNYVVKIAAVEGIRLISSVVESSVYTVGEAQKAATPSFAGKTGGDVAIGQSISVEVESADADAVIYYTTDGTDPDAESATATEGVITWSPSVSGNYVIKISATAKDKSMSDIATSGEYVVSGTSYGDICKPVIESTSNSSYISDAVLVDANGVLGEIDFSGILKDKNQTGATPEIKAYPGATFSIKYTFVCNWNDEAFYQIENGETSSPVKTYGPYGNGWPGDGTHGTKTGLYNMQQSGIDVDMDAQTAVFPFTLRDGLKPGDLVVIRHICAKSVGGACANVNEANYVDILFRIVADPTPKYTVTLINEDGYGKAYFDGNESETVKKVNQGESVTIHAKANSGYEFAGWTMRMNGTDIPLDKDTYPADMTFNDVEFDMAFIAKFTKATGVEGSDADTVNIYANAGVIYIKGFTGVARIYNIAGQIVNEVKVAESAAVKTEQGVYIVKIADKVVRVVVK